MALSPIIINDCVSHKLNLELSAQLLFKTDYLDKMKSGESEHNFVTRISQNKLYGLTPGSIPNNILFIFVS